GVCNRVETGSRRNTPRLRNRESRIEERDAKRCFWIATRHLRMCLGVGNQRVTLSFTSGAGGGRYRNHRQHRLSRLSVAAIVRHAATVGQQKIDALGAVHRAATTE